MSAAGPAYELPMFPLGTVLFPSMLLPLHIFEPRYRALARVLVRAPGVQPEFGVVLIERGHEVGGDDVRTNVGTVARVRRAQELPDGRWALLTAGTRRIRVEEWLPDDPYPRAMVVDLVDGEGTVDEAAWAAVEAKLRRSLALAAELGEARAPAIIELAADRALATLQAAAVAPIGPLDQQALLALDDPAARLARLDALLDDQLVVLEARLAGG